jgi:uncharacterized protein DUF6364
VQTKLTLRMDDDLVRKAKEYARRSGKSVSTLVADFFGLLGQRKERDRVGLSPTVRSLLGALGDGTGNPEREYRRHLAKKHR